MTRTVLRRRNIRLAVFGDGDRLKFQQQLTRNGRTLFLSDEIRRSLVAVAEGDIRFHCSPFLVLKTSGAEKLKFCL